MNIALLHGNDSNRSYLRLLTLIDSAKNRGLEIIYPDESSLSLAEVISGKSLFQKERFFVVRNVPGIPKRDLDFIFKKTKTISGNLVIYHDDFLSNTLVKLLPPQARIEEFKLPKIIFKFLDSFYPKNAKAALWLFHEVIKIEPPEFVFALLSKHIRDLYWAKTDFSTLPYQAWRVGKLKRQSSFFKNGVAAELILRLSEIDVAVKTSKADLVSSLDLLIVTKLE